MTDDEGQMTKDDVQLLSSFVLRRSSKEEPYPRLDFTWYR
jgi:hypothetical protein